MGKKTMRAKSKSFETRPKLASDQELVPMICL